MVRSSWPSSALSLALPSRDGSAGADNVLLPEEQGIGVFEHHVLGAAVQPRPATAAALPSSLDASDSYIVSFNLSQG